MQVRSHLQGAPVASVAPAAVGLLRRKCGCGGSAKLGGECEECRRKKLQRSIASPAGGARQEGSIPRIVQSVLRASGSPLDPATRSFMEPRFGHDFGSIRVHTGAEAAQSARSVNALAYTVGHHIVFGEGQYSPATRGGRELMAHELTHTIQQGEATPTVTGIGLSDDPSEREASHAAERVMSGAADSHSVTARETGVIRRQEDPRSDKPSESASETAATDNVTASDARRAFVARIGEERYRLLEQRLFGGFEPGESVARAAGSVVSAGGLAPQISRMAAVPPLQALGPAIPIAGALAAVALCAFGFYFYALDNFPGKSDKWLHCWTSCKIAAWCCGPAPGPTVCGPITALLGLGKEVLDAICEAMGDHCGAEWEDVFADLKGIACAAVPLLPCSTCCDNVV